jgi:acyl carrier protein
MEIPQKLKDYLNEARSPLPPISDLDEPLKIDSLGLIRLVAFLETELGIRIEDEELLAENFVTTRTLRDLLASKNPPPETN